MSHHLSQIYSVDHLDERHHSSLNSNVLNIMRIFRRVDHSHVSFANALFKSDNDLHVIIALCSLKTLVRY